MPTCLECFCATGFKGHELQKYIDENHPNFICERTKCSHHSPGPVANDEALAFILINPLHYDKERDVVIPDAFQELTNRDLSTLRVSVLTKDEANKTKEQLIQRGRERIPSQLRLVDEVCVASVEKIRNICESGRRIIAVYDTAFEHTPSHASIFTRSDVLDNRRLRKVVRNRVHETFSKNRIHYDEFVNGLSN